MEPLLEIIDAEYLHDYVVKVKFNNDEEANVDLAPMLEGDTIGVFEPLKNIDFFRQFYVNYTLCWNDDIDVAPEYIYFLAHQNDKTFEPLFKQWGYIS